MRALRRRSTLAVVAAGLVALAVLAWPAGAAGPWRAQIVDAETGQPLEGVVVLARWDDKTAGWPHPDRRFHDVDEVVSDADGRIVIPARDLSRNTPVRAIVGPDIAMFKAGYGRWRFRADGPRAKQGWQHFATDGVVVELPLARTRDERLFALESAMPAGDVPPHKFPRMRAAYDAERVRLGLSPLRREDRE
jgi:hypothetical protein